MLTPKPAFCSVCATPCPSLRAARAHCKPGPARSTKPGRRPIPTFCPRCATLCASRTEAARHCATGPTPQPITHFLNDITIRGNDQ